MTVNCNDVADCVAKLFVDNERLTMFSRGSAVYGTMTKESDRDMAIVVADDTDFIDQDGVFDNEKCDIRLHQFTIEMMDVPKTDVQVVRESDFIDMINEHTPFALEAILLTNEVLYNTDDNKKTIADYRQYFKLNKWLLRESFGSVSNNSFAKAKKKMTVKKDLDMRCGAKSLFHSIRLLMYACQIAENGLITDFYVARPLYTDIFTDLENGFKWDDFKVKYKPVWNEWHSKLVKLCPKPREKYKNSKKEMSE